MNWNDFLDDAFTTEADQRRRLRQLKQQVTTLRNSLSDGSRSQSDLRDELDAMEFNFARLLLLVQSLTTTLLRKNLITSEELKAVIAEIDLLDGKTDQLLDPAAMPGMQAQAAEPTSLADTLQELRRRKSAQPEQTVRDYLQDLEDQQE